MNEASKKQTKTFIMRENHLKSDKLNHSQGHEDVLYAKRSSV